MIAPHEDRSCPIIDAPSIDVNHFLSISPTVYMQLLYICRICIYAVYIYFNSVYIQHCIHTEAVGVNKEKQ